MDVEGDIAENCCAYDTSGANATCHGRLEMNGALSVFYMDEETMVPQKWRGSE